MTQDIEKLALVTGASRGLGAACAEYLAAHGYHIVALARTTGALEELDDRIQAKGGAATLVPVDITNARPPISTPRTCKNPSPAMSPPQPS